MYVSARHNNTTPRGSAQASNPSSQDRRSSDQLAEELAAPEPLDLGDVVEGQVEVVQVFELVQALHLADDVGLEVQDLQLLAVADGLDLLDLQLVQADLLQGRLLIDALCEGGLLAA